MTQEVFNRRTLVEINLVDSIFRYCLQEDLYLLDGFSTSQIAQLIYDGTIDEESAEDLVVTGPAVIEALNNGLTTTAESLLTLATTSIQGVTTSTSSEYTTLNSIYKLYKQGIVKDIQVADTLPDASYGVVEVDNITAEIFDDSGELLDNIANLQGSSIKVRAYDVNTGELHTVAYGTINEVRVGEDRQITLVTGNPDTQALDTEFPTIKVSDLIRVTSEPGVTLRLADDESAKVPIFFGKARRLQVPNIDKFYGTTTTTPNYLDAYSDYAIGGPLINNYGEGTEYFPYVLSDLTFVTTTGLYREWLGITNRVEFDDSSTRQFNRFVFEDAKVPSFRFQAYQIDTVTRSSVQDLPHNGTTTNVYDNIAASYPDLVPVIEVLHVYGGYVKGRDWVQGADGYSSSIKWGAQVGFTEPPATALASTVQLFTRGTPRNTSDYLIDNDGETTRVFSNILNIVSVTQYVGAPGITGEVYNYNGGTYSGADFAPLSSNPLRVFQDTVDWGFSNSANRFKFEFNGDLFDSKLVGETTTLLSSGGQPYFYNDESLEFIDSETLGTLYQAYDGATSYTGMVKRWLLYTEVSANIDNQLVGEIVSRYDPGEVRGYTLGVSLQDSLFGDGVTTRYLPYFLAEYGGEELFNTWLSGATTSSYNLADGAIHSIMIVSLDINPGTAGVVYLYVDNVLEAFTTDFHDGSNNAIAPFIIGGTTGVEFRGKVHYMSASSNPRNEPLPGTTYYVEFQYQPDSYKAEWTYLVSTASNPIQYNTSDQPYVIAGDFKTNGCDVEPENDIMVLSGSTTSYSWNKYKYKQGYSVTLNDPAVIQGGDAYGTISLEDTTKVNYEHDFCIYAAASWLGITTDKSGDLLCKPYTSTTASYYLGITNGYLFGQIRSRGSVTSLQSNITVNDGRLHFLMLERNGYTMNLYVDDSLVATSRVGRSREELDYDNTKDIVVGGTTVTGNHWQGDVLFVGASNDSPGSGFAAMQTALLQSGIKGTWTGTTTNRKTSFHIPFIEGSGITCSSRNLARNAAYNVKRLVSDGTFGTGEKVDGASFDRAARILDDAGLPVDFVTRAPRKVADILKDICVVRGMQLKKNSNNRWKVQVDDINDEVSAYFGFNDGYWNNITKIKEYRLVSLEDRVKTVTLKYRYMPNATGELEYLASTSRPVLPLGVQEQEILCPYILEHETADKCVDYLAKKLQYASTVLSIEVGQEGRTLRIGDIVSITIPHLSIDALTFKIKKIGYNIATYELDLEQYSAEIFNYTPGTYPDDENIPVGS